MKKIFAWAAMAAMIALGWSSNHALAATQKKTPAKKSSATATKSTSKKGSSTAASSKKGATSASAKGKKGSSTTKKVVTWRNRQSAPSADRYREIQDALAARGYLTPEDATGNWNQTSMEALKKFQSEQNLDSSGKINSLSLIALGLGPRRDAVAAVPKPPPGPPQAPGPGQ